MESEEQHRQWRKTSARLVARGDQVLQEFKLLYSSWSRLEQIQFREALKKLAEADEILGKLSPQARAWVEARWESRKADSGPVLAGMRGKLTPRTLLKAINVWEQGDDYTPGGMAFFG